MYTFMKKPLDKAKIKPAYIDLRYGTPCIVYSVQQVFHSVSTVGLLFGALTIPHRKLKVKTVL